VREGETLYLLAGNGLDSQWYKNVLKTPAIRMQAHGVTYEASAHATEKPEDVQWVVEAFRAKYGAGQIAALYPRTDAAVRIDLT
jgi:hypothetical protein